MKTEKNGKRNFTLIELLIVVAIIAILAGMLMPALQSALEKGRSVSCMSNLKQFSTCEAMYQGTFSDYITPPFDNSRTYAPHLHTNFYHWDYCFGKDFLNFPVNAYGWPVETSWKPFQCPTDTRTMNGRRRLSYVIPSWYGNITATHAGRRSNRIKIPSKCIFIAESNTLQYRPTATNPQRIAQCGACSSEGNVYADYTSEFGWNHGVKTNILMFDGHGAAIAVRPSIDCTASVDESQLYYTNVQ